MSWEGQMPILYQLRDDSVRVQQQGPRQAAEHPDQNWVWETVTRLEYIKRRQLCGLMDMGPGFWSVPQLGWSGRILWREPPESADPGDRFPTPMELAEEWEAFQAGAEEVTPEEAMPARATEPPLLPAASREPAQPPEFDEQWSDQQRPHDCALHPEGECPFEYWKSEPPQRLVREPQQSFIGEPIPPLSYPPSEPSASMRLFPPDDEFPEDEGPEGKFHGPAHERYHNPEHEPMLPMSSRTDDPVWRKMQGVQQTPLLSDEEMAKLREEWIKNYKPGDVTILPSATRAQSRPYRMPQYMTRIQKIRYFLAGCLDKIANKLDGV